MVNQGNPGAAISCISLEGQLRRMSIPVPVHATFIQTEQNAIA